MQTLGDTVFQICPLVTDGNHLLEMGIKILHGTKDYMSLYIVHLASGYFASKFAAIFTFTLAVWEIVLTMEWGHLSRMEEKVKVQVCF